MHTLPRKQRVVWPKSHKKVGLETDAVAGGATRLRRLCRPERAVGLFRSTGPPSFFSTSSNPPHPCNHNFHISACIIIITTRRLLNHCNEAIKTPPGYNLQLLRSHHPSGDHHCHHVRRHRLSSFYTRLAKEFTGRYSDHRRSHTSSR